LEQAKLREGPKVLTDGEITCVIKNNNSSTIADIIDANAILYIEDTKVIDDTKVTKGDKKEGAFINKITVKKA